MGKAADEAFELARERIAQAKLEGWEKLELTGKEFGDLETLPIEIEGLTALRSLSLRRTKVSDVSKLSQLTGLTSLDLGHTQVSDASALSTLTGLTWLNLGETLLSDLSALSRLTELTWLRIRGAPVSDVSVLSGLTGLTWLDLGRTKISDLSVLSNLKKLTWLGLWETPVVDLSPLSSLTGLTSLYLWGTQVIDISALSKLTALTSLDLAGSEVTDVSALSGMTRLTSLDLQNTSVADVSALSKMSMLQFLDLRDTLVDRAGLAKALRGKSGLVPSETPNSLAGPYGVRFDGCSATDSDPELEKMSEIVSDRERTLALFEYLGVEVEEKTPEPDPLLSTVIKDGKLETPASFPSPDEQEERLKQALHDRLRPRAADCAQKAGNAFPRMAAKARVLATLLDRPFAELDLLSVHWEIEDIEARAKSGAEDGEPYDADLLLAVGEVTRLGPGLTRGNADVELYERRFKETRERVVDANVDGPRAALSDAILASPNAHGSRSLALEERMKDAADPDMARTLRDPKQRNLLWRLGSVAALAVSRVGKDLASDTAGGLIKYALGPAITAFVVKNWALLMDVAATYGVGFASWIAGTVGLLMMGKGVKEERDKRKWRDEDDGAL